MISYLAQPNTIEPSYSNLVFQFLSTGATDSSKYKYRYVVDVYIQEGSDEQDGQVAQLKITPSSEGWGQVDISPILRNYTHSKPVNAGCSGSTPLHTSAWGYLDSNMIVYSIKVGEEYASSANGTIFTYDGKGEVGEPDVRSSVCYAYNGVKEWFNGKNYDFEPYYLTGNTAFSSGVCRFMTNSPRTRYIRTGDYSTLAALNYMDTTTDLNSREIYSALFTFYDNNDSVISTGRTYNVYDLCGTRPNCSYYDGFWETPTNWAEQQVVYLGVGVPNIEEHGISFPSNTQYYKVQLEGTLSQPTPPTPTIDTFSGCSCYDYQVENVSAESQVSLTYLDCFGVEQSLTLNPETFGQFCACQNTINFTTSLPSDYVLTQLLDCDYCNCRTFRIQNPDPDFELSYSGYSCSGGTINGSVPPDDEVYICACEGSVASADGLIISDESACPVPFSADCRDVAISHTGSTPQTLTYTGCCGTEQTISVPPAVSAVGIKMNYPFPTDAGWTITDFGSTTPGDCPPDPIPPSPTTFGTGDNIIAQNVCDDTLMYFSYTGDTLEVGKFVNYENTAYEILAVGGGGFVPLNYPYVFDNEEDALAAFPCPTTSTGLCLDTTFISEPFYFYLDGICSAGDRVVYFMNKFGAWDSYNFRAKEDTGYGIEKEEYKSAPELYSQGWDSNSYYGWNAKRNVWNNQVNKSGILFTDFMPQSETIWLTEELFQSPSVYLVGDDGVLEPITITNSEVIVPNYQVGSSKYQIQIEYKSGYNTIRQNHE